MLYGVMFCRWFEGGLGRRESSNDEDDELRVSFCVSLDFVELCWVISHLSQIGGRIAVLAPTTGGRRQQPHVNHRDGTEFDPFA